MALDIVDLRTFYASPLGEVARRLVGRILRGRFDACHGHTVLGLGYATPYLGVYRGEAVRVTEQSTSNISRKFNLPPSYVLIHRVSTAGTGVLCQLEAEGPFRAELIKWLPGYGDTDWASSNGDPDGPTHDEQLSDAAAPR